MSSLATDSIAVYDDDIELYLAEYCDTRGIDNPYDITPSQWSRALGYICDHVFKPDRSILRPPGMHGGAYDLNAVLALVDRYIDLCQDHNQRVSIMGFSRFSGISCSTLQDWGSGRDRGYMYYSLDGKVLSGGDIQKALLSGEYVKKPTSGFKSVYQKLVNYEGQSLQDLLQDRKRPPMTILPLFNAFQARHATKQEQPQLDTGSIAESLGITAELQGIPDKKSHSSV